LSKSNQMMNKLPNHTGEWVLKREMKHDDFAFTLRRHRGILALGRCSANTVEP